MSELSISTRNTYLTTRQWNNIVEYVESRKKNIKEVNDRFNYNETNEIAVSSSSTAYIDISQATNVSEMYEILLGIMMDAPEKLFEITEDELKVLYNNAVQMNEENPSDDYIDLIDTLQYLAGEYDLNDAKILVPDGYKVLTSSVSSLTSGGYYLNSDLTISTMFNTPSGADITIDLNGYVLRSNNAFIGIVGRGSTFTIIDSNPNRSHFGTLDSNGVWTYNPNATSGVEIKGGIITGGTGDRGGAFIVSGVLNLNGGTIAGCVAYEGSADKDYEETNIHYPTGGAGGAIYVQADANYSGKFVMNGGSIKYCSSDPDIKSYGGAVFIDAENSRYGEFVMNGGTIEYCTAYRGGAVYVHKDLSEGSSVVGIFNMNGGTISNNTSRSDGGGVYSNGKFTMVNGSIKNNTTKKTGTNDEGISIYSSYGGGLYVYGANSSFTMNGGIISGNEAASGGGFMIENSTFTMNGGEISGNYASSSGGSGNGGAIYVQASVFNFNNGILQNNWASRYGGAININQTGTLNLNGSCKILNNSASQGGGISQEAGDCRIKFLNDEILISGNTARNDGNGGGLFIEKGTVDITAGTISGNIASGKGGGLSMCVQRIAGNITVNMTGGKIIDNEAGLTGGGLDIFADYKDSTSSTNHVKIYLDGGLVDNNKSISNGGAIHVWVNEDNSDSLIQIGKDNSDNEIIVTNNFSGASGGAISISSGDVIMNSGNLSLNSAEENGGSVYVTGGNFSMFNGLFNNNTSKLLGGAVYINDGNVNIESGTLSNNISLDSGGAIAVTSGDVVIGKEECYIAGKSSTHAHPVIESNVALNGVGIYVDGGATTMWCGDIKYNHTYDKTVNVLVISGGNFVYNGGTIGIPYDSGVFVNGGIFNDNTEESKKAIKHELYYHSVLGNEIYNGKIPESKWIASPRGDVLHIEDCDDTTPTWADLFTNYSFVGWENKSETDTEKIVNLYAIWEAI